MKHFVFKAIPILASLAVIAWIGACDCNQTVNTNPEHPKEISTSDAHESHASESTSEPIRPDTKEPLTPDKRPESILPDKTNESMPPDTHESHASDKTSEPIRPDTKEPLTPDKQPEAITPEQASESMRPDATEPFTPDKSCVDTCVHDADCGSIGPKAVCVRGSSGCTECQIPSKKAHGSPCRKDTECQSDLCVVTIPASRDGVITTDGTCANACTSNNDCTGNARCADYGAGKMCNRTACKVCLPNGFLGCTSLWICQQDSECQSLMAACSCCNQWICYDYGSQKRCTLKYF